MINRRCGPENVQSFLHRSPRSGTRGASNQKAKIWGATRSSGVKVVLTRWRKGRIPMNPKTWPADYLSDYRRENVRGFGAAKRTPEKVRLRAEPSGHGRN